MTVGSKIRKYRMLKGLTQKELGLMVGFSEATADSRIRKYESDAMAPKAVIRKSLADALDVDLSALSDIDISTYEDVMQVLFQFEDDFGMDIKKKDGRTYLSFRDDNAKIQTLTTFMNIWITETKKLLPDPEHADEEQKRVYALWKARFAGNVEEYFSNKRKEITVQYEPLVSAVNRLYSYAGMTSDINHLFKRMKEAGMKVSEMNDNKYVASGFTFVVEELLSPKSEDAELLFAQFLAELHHLADSGVENHAELQMLDELLTISYVLSD